MTTTIERRDTRTRVAAMVSAVLGPIPAGVALSLAVGATAGRGWLAGLGWGLLAIAIAALVPAVVTRSLRDQARSRRQRLTYLAITAGCATVGALLLVALNAPRHVIGLELALTAGVIVASLANVWTAVSNHVSALTGGVVIAATYVNPLLALVAVTVPALAWSRVVLVRHTTAQCLTAALLGPLSAGIIVSLVR